MRAGWTPKLRALLHRADPALHLIAEVVQVKSSDVKDTLDEWAAAYSTAGVQVLESGGLMLYRDTATAITQASDDATEATGLSHALPAMALLIQWTGADAERRELANLVARLHPRVDGGVAKDVTQWRAAIYRVLERGPDDDRIMVAEIGSATAAAPGDSASDITFDFTWDEHIPVVGPAPKYHEAYAGTQQSYPETLIRVWGVTSTGAPASNVAWMADSTIGGTLTGVGFSVTHYSISEGPTSQGDEQGSGTVILLDNPVASMPRFALNRASYAIATVTFSTSGNRIQGLGTIGSQEVVADGQAPNGSTLAYEIQPSGGGAWIAVVDGDVIGVDNSARGGSDLSALTPSASWNMRVTLTPSSDGFVSPIVRRLGVREVTTTDLSGVATVQGAVWQVEPRSLKGNITKATVRILKTGEKDYLDYGSQILSSHHIGEIEVRVWIGDPTYDYLARSEWLHLDSFEVEDYVNEDTAHVLTCISPLRRLRKKIPPFTVTSGTDGTREPVEYANVTIKAAAADIVDGQIGLPGRFRGPLLEDTATVTKTIRDADAKDELDRLAYLARSGVITSQGRVKAVRMMGDGQAAPPPVAVFYPGDYTPVYIGPGYASRVDEFFVPYQWEEDEEGNGSFVGEARYFNATATEKLGGRGLQTTERLDDETAKWIADDTLADAVARRIPNHFANGLMLWEIRATYGHPHLEPGDPVVIVTDKYVGRSPKTDKPIRGPVAGSGVVATVGDPWGRSLLVWVRALDDIVLGDGAVDRKGYRTPVFRHARIVFGEDESVRFQGQLRPGLSLKAAISDTTFPAGSAVLLEDLGTTDASGNFDIELAALWELEDPAYVSAYAFEFGDGSGAISRLWRGKATNNAGELYDWRFLYDQPAVDQVTVKWTRGSAVDTVWIWHNELAVPMSATATPFPAPGGEGAPLAILPIGTDQYVFDIPAAGKVAFIQFESRDADAKLLHVYRYELHPKAVSSGSDLPPGSVIAEALVASAQTWGFDGEWEATGDTSVSWTAGVLTLASGSQYEINSGSVSGLGAANQPTFIYFDSTVSATDFQATRDWADVIGDDSVFIALVWAGQVLANIVPGVGVLGLDGDVIHPLSIQTDHLAANSVTAAKISVIALSAISADLGTVTAGTIEADIEIKSKLFSGSACRFTNSLTVGDYMGGTGGLLMVEGPYAGVFVLEGEITIQDPDGDYLFYADAQVGTSGGIMFFKGQGGSNTAVEQQDVTGSRGGNAALASLLTALDAYGLITDSTS